VNRKLHIAVIAALGVSITSTVFAAKATMAPTPVTCDRACLVGLVDTYIAAMVAHDASKVAFAPGAKFVENIKSIKPGEGLWATASAAPKDFKIVVPDVAAQQVGFIAVMEEITDGKSHPIEVGARLKLDNGKIVEAEHVVVHSIRETSLKNLEKPNGVFLLDVPEPYRDSRSRLMHIGRSYYDALDLNNGSLAPFADDCLRRENGMQTVRNVASAGPPPGATAPQTPPSPFSGPAGTVGCAAQLDSQVFTYIDSIDNVRMVAADEQTGLAIGFSHFRHSMAKKEFRVFGVPGVETRPMNFNAFDLPAVHIYKIYGGKIHDVEALGFTTAYMAPTGWE
jgi:hypothetical protein